MQALVVLQLVGLEAGATREQDHAEGAERHQHVGQRAAAEEDVGPGFRLVEEAQNDLQFLEIAERIDLGKIDVRCDLAEDMAHEGRFAIGPVNVYANYERHLTTNISGAVLREGERVDVLAVAMPVSPSASCAAARWAGPAGWRAPSS